MSWDDAPPSENEIKNIGSSGSWNSAPPSNDELAKIGKAPKAGYEGFKENYDRMQEQGDTSNDALFNTLTLGYLPQIKAKAKQIFAGGGVSNDDSYVHSRDQEIKDMAARAEKFPGAHAEGVGAGLAAPMLLSGGAAAASPATLGQVIDKGSRMGALFGALSNPGDDEGKVAPLNLDKTWDRAENTAIGGVTGGTVAAGFHGLGKLGQAASDMKPVPKANASEIAEASRRLGIEPTPGMLNDGHFLQGTESSLDQSPSIAGRLMREKTNPVRAGLNSAAEKTFQDASTGISPFEAGESAKNDLMSKVGERLGPLQMSYDEIGESTRHAELNPKGIAAVARNIESLPEVKLMKGSAGATKAEQYAGWLKNAKSVDDLTTIRTAVRHDLRAAQGAEQEVLAQIYDKISDLRQSSLEFAAKNAAPTPKQGENIARDLSAQLKETDQGYRGLMQDLQSFGENAKLGNIGTPREFTGAVDSLKSEQLADKLFNLGDNRLLGDFKAKFPEAYETLRKAKLAQFQKQAIGVDGKVSPQKMATQMGKLGPEARAALLGEQANIPTDSNTVLNSLPPNVNPSKTSVGESFKDSINPFFQAKELARYGAYKMATTPGEGKLQQFLMGSPKFAEMARTNPGAYQKLVSGFGGKIGQFTPAAAAQNNELDHDSSTSSHFNTTPENPEQGKKSFIDGN